MLKRRLLAAFYGFLRPLVRVALRVFYRRISINGGEKLKRRGPVIIVSNHPNTLIDPFVVAIHSNQIIHFLANAGLFDSRFGYWFFSTFYCFPIQRSIDKVNRQIDNNDSFERMQVFLSEGGTLFIAPEGGSDVGRYIKPLRTGTARIAMNTAVFRNWKTELTILPVGLVYESPVKFRSRVWVNVGEPIRVKDFRTAYEADSYQAVRELTDVMELQLQSLTLHLPDAAEEQLLERLRQIATNIYPRDFVPVVEKMKSIQQNWRNHPPEDIRQVEAYFGQLKDLGFEDRTVLQWQEQKDYSFGAMILALPLFLWGAINNLPVWLLGELPLRMGDIYPTYHGTVRFLGGFLAVVVFYPFQYLLVLHHFGLPVALLYLVILIPSGIFAAYFAFRWLQWLALRRFRRMAGANPEAAEALVKTRQAIIDSWQL